MISIRDRLSRWETAIVLLLALLAAIRVFIYSAAFPFFSNVDEDLHLDLVVTYSHAQLPTQITPVMEESLDWIVPYASPEYLQEPSSDGIYPPPLWKQDIGEAAPVMEVTKEVWRKELNFESPQPPLYYILAAAWWRLGRLLGLTGITALYWIRFLNVPLIAGMVWLGYLASRCVSPDNVGFRIGVPVLLAGVPQNVFYSINNDVLSPVISGCLLVLLLTWLCSRSLMTSLAVGIGITMAATYLTKLTNLPFVLVAGLVVLAAAYNEVRSRQASALPTLGALIASAFIPILAWMLWTKYHFGDFTGTTAKMATLGWTKKPLMSWIQHPIFTGRGVVVFLRDLLDTFWRGETKWHGRPLNGPIADSFYWLSSILLTASALLSLRPSSISSTQRRAIMMAAATFLGCIIFLAFLSIQFDFGNCIFPSRIYPYFASGRLMTGALIPFAVMYMQGINFLLRRIHPLAPLLAIGLIALGATISGIEADRAAFSSEHNWFHR